MVGEAQVIESEEFFEQGRNHLADKRYKEAIKDFAKSHGLNRGNYDALFYKGVA
jgi:outer membrane protein assembly factor BamD (BamD/ComL family)